MHNVANSHNLNESTLIDCEEKHQQMEKLILLKLAASWLEKQEWVNSPYGGQNPVQDLLFQTQLTANRIWENFFSKKESRNGTEDLKRHLSDMRDLTPEIRRFFDGQFRVKLENSFSV